MIEVTAKLIRGAVYLAGESVECYITFSNTPAPIHKRSHSNNDALESLAWASAQIHCQCTTNSKVVYPGGNSYTPEEVSTSNTDTSFAPCRGERGHVVLSTKPRILFCDLRLSTGESKSFLYSEVLPNEAPPSYRGQAVKYSYKITVGMQRVNCPIKLLRVPLRVLVVNGFQDISLSADSEELAPSNPFLEVQQKESPFELTIQALQNLTAKRSPSFYNITKSQGKVVRFCLFKQAYKLGEDIVGTFDFSEATIPCVQYSVVLQSEEEIAAGYRRWTNQSSSIMSYTKYHEMCISLKYSQLILPIPLHITPGFSTDLVKLQWRLHFEFVTSVPQAETEEWHAPSTLNIETMVWNLPIKIYPTTPHQISHGLQTQSKPRLVV
ncbi:hypothetical protein L9F63_001909 [Diploptera punctata]|uniref:RAB6A-GEF complex partner protein 2 n=1 Tax=Diploptera punctata TaxID=6984 RepID=A0AAD8A3P7_DIPPU|nr:hypothetical protein L9F63_001909 [Diploptera punctata]